MRLCFVTLCLRRLVRQKYTISWREQHCTTEAYHFLANTTSERPGFATQSSRNALMTSFYAEAIGLYFSFNENQLLGGCMSSPSDAFMLM